MEKPKNLHIADSVETPYVRLELLESGILIAWYKRRKNITLDVAKDIVQTRLDFVGRVPRPVLVMNLGVLDMNTEARRYVGTGDGIDGIKAAAVVRDHAATAFIMSLIIAIEKPPFPYKEFSGRGRALLWLSNFL